MGVRPVAQKTGGYEVVFRGKLVRGMTQPQVVANLARLFKTSPERIERLFSGGRHVLKSGLTEAQAHRYRQALKQAGAIVVVVDNEAQADLKALRETVARPAATQPAAQRPATQQAGRQRAAPGDDLLAPAGAPVNDPPPPPPEPQFDLSGFRLDEPGVVIVETEPPPEPQISIEHLQIAQDDSPHERPRSAEPPPVDTEAIGFASDDTPLEPPRNDPPPRVDLSRMRLED